MHARMTRLKADPAQMDEATQTYRDTLARFADIDGNRGTLLLIDRASGTGIGISFWQDEDAMAAGAERARDLREQAADHVSSQIEAVEEFEVAAWNQA